MLHNIHLEVYNLYSYNFGFLNTFNDTLIHLVHWQYWWWFWFTFLLTLYYVFFMRFFYFRSLKFNPKIATSYRSHGKWGDLIICLLPISWCLNILSNSTTLLKLLEWQHESNFFTLRVRGKQWYWVYKFDFRSLVENLYTHKLSKQVGRSMFYNNQNIYNKNNFYSLYNSLLKLKYAAAYEDKLPEFVKSNNIFSIPKPKFTNIYYTVDCPPVEELNEEEIKRLIEILSKDPIWLIYTDVGPVCWLPESFWENYGEKLQPMDTLPEIPGFEEIRGKTPFARSAINLDDIVNINTPTNTDANINSTTQLNINKSNQLLNDYSLNRFARDILFTNNSIELLKSKDNVFFPSNSSILNLLKFRYEFNNIKQFNNNFYVVLKQKPISDWSKFDASSNFSIQPNYGDFVSSYSDSFIFNDSDRLQYYNNMRLLRLNKMLFLPVGLQISVITNSFDVIHSWFIPGLGLKMDCVPGRSTHHTLYVDLPGIYYGQCAEICGRFHHHMPIRVCALDFEHYMLWFNHFVLSSMIDLDLDKMNNAYVENIRKLF